jgi:hypothetical protein
MQDDNQKPKVYRISYKDEKGNHGHEVFSASTEEAKNRREKFKQEHKNYTEIKLSEIPSLDVFRDTLKG